MYTLRTLSGFGYYSSNLENARDDKSMNARVETTYTGRVHGVGFRQTAATVARGFRIVCFVKNRPGGTVKLVVVVCLT